MKSTLICSMMLLLATAFSGEPISLIDIYPQEKTIEVISTPQIEKNIQVLPEIEQKFGYVTLGVDPLPIPWPMLSFGYRAQRGHHGSDFSVGVTTCFDFECAQVRFNFLYYYYFNPSLISQVYMGIGIAPAFIYGTNKPNFLLSPEVVIGKQYRNNSNNLRFIQLQVLCPTVGWITDALYYHHRPKNNSFRMTAEPIVILSYGIGF